jgi:hypothetical protein
MTAPQRQAAMALLRASLSAKGLALTEAIRRTDQTLREVNGDPLSYDEELYFFTVIGRPSATEPWGWQIDGHHLANDIEAQADRDNHVIDYAGVKAAALPAPLKARLLALAGLYVGNLRDAHAAVRLREVAAHLDDTWFAWAGGVSDDAVFYYRIHSPVILIEFDHQVPVGATKINQPGKPTRAHIHTVVRTPNGNDYGKDLLRQHLAQHPH